MELLAAFAILFIIWGLMYISAIDDQMKEDLKFWKCNKKERTGWYKK